jgi:signal transduction histidine kinase
MSRRIVVSGVRRAARGASVAGPRASGATAVPALKVDGSRTMSASKYPEPEPRQKLGPRAARPPAARPDSGAVVIVQEKVLAEISHELGNFFHKLYYWSEYLKDPAAREAADSTAAQMLERTIKNLEDFLKVSLGYFNPVQLATVSMGVSDVIEGLMFQVRAHLNGTPVAVSQGDWEDAAVMVDPGQISQALEVAVRHLTKQVGAESRLRIVAERSARRDCPGLEVVFYLHGPAESSPLFRTAEAGVEWAVAQRVIALHGGELSEQITESGEKTLTIFLPLQPMIEV